MEDGDVLPAKKYIVPGVSCGRIRPSEIEKISTVPISGNKEARARKKLDIWIMFPKVRMKSR